MSNIFKTCFNTDAGEKVMENLEALTLKRAYGPLISDAELRHLEGQRWIVNYIKQQILRKDEE